jgi:hypothetical protein
MSRTERAADEARGSCYCGAVRFVARFPSRFCAHCHCRNCRRAHGAAFVTWVGFDKAQVEVVAGEERLGRYLTETDATRSFCTTCGTTLFFESPRWAGELHVVRAAFDDPVDREVKGNAFYESRADWMDFTKPIHDPAQDS